MQIGHYKYDIQKGSLSKKDINYGIRGLQFMEGIQKQSVVPVGLHSCPKIIVRFVLHVQKIQVPIIMELNMDVAVVVTNYFFNNAISI